MLTYKQLLQKCNREVLNSILLSKTLEGMQQKYANNSKDDLLKKAWNTVNEGYGYVIDTCRFY